MKLSEIQAQLKVPKNNRNNFGNYNYRSAEDIVEAVKKIINPSGLSLVITDEVLQVGNRIYIKATATIGEWSATGWAREEETKKGMDASQITGSASSYARKYALNGLLAIDDTKDADATNIGEITETPVQIAIGDIRLCKTVEDLKTLKATLPKEVISDKAFSTAATARYNQLTKTPA
jgi:hypothetical protein